MAFVVRRGGGVGGVLAAAAMAAWAQRHGTSLAERAEESPRAKESAVRKPPPNQFAAAARPARGEPAAAATELPPLHAAITLGDLTAALALLQKEGTGGVDERDADGLTPLAVAAKTRGVSAGVVNFLIAHGADVDVVDRLGRTPLHLASLSGNAQATRALIAAGADVARGDVRRGATAAHYAAAFSRVDAIKLLAGGDSALALTPLVDVRDKLGRSPLHWSALAAHRDPASSRSIDVADALLHAGASARARDKSGATPAHTAARLGAQSFLNHLVQVDERADSSNSTSSSEEAPAAPTLARLSRRPLLDECDNNGVTPLDIAYAKYRQTRNRARFLCQFPQWTGLGEAALAVQIPRIFGL